jgi:hypothetical protein
VVLGLALLASCGEGTATTAPADHAGQDREQRAIEREIAELRRELEHQRELRQQRAAASDDEVSGGANANAGQSTPLAGLTALGDRLGAQVGATLGVPGGPITAGGDLRTGSAWSTIKVPIALRVLEDAGGPTGVTAEQRGLIAQALTASDNEAAAALFDQLAQEYGGIDGARAAVTEVLREGGDPVTEVSTVGRDGFSPYGQTEWSLEDQHRFMSGLASGCVGSAASSDYVLDLMSQVTSDTWGLGSVGVPARWKGGWGPGVDGRYLLRQMGVLEADGAEVVVTLAVIPDDGDFAHGQVIATEVARQLADSAASLEARPAPTC